MKTRPSKTKIFIWKFIPITTLSFTITKKPKIFKAQKSLKVLKLLRIFIDSIVFRFHRNRIFFWFFIDMIFFRVLSDRVFSESSVIGSSSGSTALLGYQCCFSAMSLFFLSNRAATFFIKNRCFVLHYILKTKFV